MKKIATLGPAGTYSDIAAKQYQRTVGETVSLEHFPSINQALKAVGQQCDLAVLPIENFSEGYVSLVLDHVMASDLTIINEIILPIHFCCVANTQDLAQLQNLWVQFVARGQCSEFIDSLKAQAPNLQIITTETNMVSHQRWLESTVPSAAIVPAQAFADEQHVVAPNVNDFKNNQTRFFVLSNQGDSKAEQVTIARSESSQWKTSLVIIDDNDRPGLLAEILTSFSKRNVNLTSIVSRPTKVRFGTYNFMIDIEGHIHQTAVIEAIEEVRKVCTVRNLGSYPAAVVK